jgi:hypothetical protein
LTWLKNFMAPVTPSLMPRRGVAHAAEGRVLQTVAGDFVDVGGAGFKFLGGFHGGRQVIGDHSAAQAEPTGIVLRNGVIQIADGNDGSQRAKAFFSTNFRFARDVGKDRWFEQRAGAAAA